MRNKLLKRPASALSQEPSVRQLRSRSILVHQPPASTRLAHDSSEKSAPAPARIPPRSSPQLMLKNAAEEEAVMHTVVQIERGIARPTSEWRVVPKGVPCPPGCEYRMDLATGLNWVRRLRTDDTVIRGDPSCSAIVIRPSCASPSHRRDEHKQAYPGQKSLLKRSRQPTQSSGSKHETGRAHVVDLSKPASSLVPQNTLQPASKPRVKSVHSEHTHRKASFRKDGSQEDSREAVRTHSATCRDRVSGGLVGEKITSRKKSSVRCLADGRAVVVQTVTVEKTTYLPRRSQRA